jgi:hypothetical protein
MEVDFASSTNCTDPATQLQRQRHPVITIQPQTKNGHLCQVAVMVDLTGRGEWIRTTDLTIPNLQPDSPSVTLGLASKSGRRAWKQSVPSAVADG